MAVPRRASADHASLFLDRYQQLLNDARRLAGASDVARDLVHDAFVQFVSQAPPLETIDRVDAYLHGMLRKLHLSRRRRASVRLELAVSDYDSLATAIRVPDPERRMEIADQLAAVCRYACARKESSKTGSVLILRFFRGLYPEEVARISGLSTEAVAQWLRLARAEARTAINAPGQLGFLTRVRGCAGERAPGVTTDGRPRGGEGPLVYADLRASDGPEVWVAALRQAIAMSRRGPCLSEEDLDTQLVDGRGSTKSVMDTETLAHVASCEPCLLRLSGRAHVQVDPAAGLDTALGRAPRLFVRAAVGLATMLMLFTYRAEVNAAAHVVGHLLTATWSRVSSVVRPAPRIGTTPTASRNGGEPKAMTPTPSLPNEKSDDGARVPGGIASPAASRESLADVEVAILEALDTADALAGEEVAVTRTAAGLRVYGIVEDPARRRALASLLRRVGTDARVEIALRSSGAAAARGLRRANAARVEAPANRVRAELIDVAARSYPLLPRVERWLLDHPERAGRFGADARTQALHIAREALRHAGDARMRMAVALDIEGRFEGTTLPPAARVRLDRLVRRHLALAHGELQALESWVTPVAGTAAPVMAPVAAVPNSSPSLRAAFDAVRMVDAMTVRQFAVAAPSRLAGAPVAEADISAASLPPAPSGRDPLGERDDDPLHRLMSTLGASIASLKQLEDWFSHDES